jgi:hypothetical protein
MKMPWARYKVQAAKGQWNDEFPAGRAKGARWRAARTSGWPARSASRHCPATWRQGGAASRGRGPEVLTVSAHRRRKIGANDGAQVR